MASALRPGRGLLAGPSVPVSLLLAAWAVRRGSSRLAWILLVSYVAIVGRLGIAVVRQ